MRPIRIENLGKVPAELVGIKSSYKTLHFDEVPVLFSGVNTYGNKIIGSHLEDDDDEKRSWFIHTIVTNQDFYSFLHRKKSYLDLLKDSNSIFLIEKTYSNNLVGGYSISFDHIPDDYRPLPNSYCPITQNKKSFAFSLALKGKLADANLAIAEEVSHIQNAFATLIEETLKGIRGFELKPKALLQPYSPGSFRINLEVQIEKNKKNTLFPIDAPFEEYVQELLKYLTTSFVEDKKAILEHAKFKSEELLELEKVFLSLYEKSHIKPPTNIHDELDANIKQASNNLEKITDDIGQHYDEIEFLNVLPQGEEHISYIDKEYSEKFQNIIEEIQSATRELVVDNDFQTYSIYIYHLNTDSRQGNALIKNFGEDDGMSKPKFKISGDEPLEGTRFTESLHLSKFIQVSAKAKRVGQKYKYLEIRFEP